jgi:hypothetical protein
MRYILIVLISGLFSANAQESGSSSIYSKVISASGFAGFHMGLQKFEKNETQWLPGPSFGGVVGAGFQFRFGRGLMLDAEGGYDLNYFSYNNTGTSLLLGYNSPFGMLRMSVMRSIRDSKFKYWYAGAGLSYMFTGNASLTDGEFDYTYTIQLAPAGVLAVHPEAGYISFLGDQSFMSVGLTFRYAWNNTITNTMEKLPELNQAIGRSNGNYIGIIIRYHHPLKVLKSKTPKGDEGGTGRIKI